MADKPLAVADVAKIVARWSAIQRSELLHELSEPEFWNETGYVVLPLKVVKKLKENLAGVPEEMEKAARVAVKLATDQAKLAERLANRDRKPDVTRQHRGEVILAFNEKDRISWKKMPSHILKLHPDWFPEFKDKFLSSDERIKFQERLRKMARDAKNRTK